jgi:3-ketosteroid 9alpha-monooxygenase subunit A
VQMGDFPNRGYPQGWFQVAWSGEIGVGGVSPLRYFGTDLVMFRTMDGQVAVLDAYCAHLGAHLGFGGRVEEDCVVCPFHAWRWNGAGENTHIPYSTRSRQARRVRSWPTVERDGFVFIWHDPMGGAPAWEPPTVPHGGDQAYLAPWPQAVCRWPAAKINAQWATENVVDQFHFTPVHGSTNPSQLIQFETDDHRFHTVLAITFGEGRAKTRLTPNGPVEAKINITVEGIGILIFEFENFSPVAYLSSQTPVDESMTDIRISVIMPRDKAVSASGLSSFGQHTLDEIRGQTDRDLAVLEHLRYTENAPLVPEEVGAYRAFRSWAKGFYAPSDGTAR